MQKEKRQCSLLPQKYTPLCCGVGLFSWAFFLSSCTHLPFPTLSAIEKEGWELSTLEAEEIPLVVARKGPKEAPSVRIYIEGDGRPFLDAEHISPNPTPTNPVALELARKDRSTSQIMYLARPGQYGTSGQIPRWWWSDGRFSPQAVRLYRKTIHALAAGRPVELVGYSGGGGVAMAVGYYAKEDGTNITQIITLAGNLNPQAVNKVHNIPPFSAIDASYGKPVDIPQQHWVGRNDTVVPPQIAYTMAEEEKKWGICVEVVEKEATHWKGWEEQESFSSPNCIKEERSR